MLTIPLEPGNAEQPISIVLNNEPYVLRVRWNSRDAAWYMDVFQRDGETSIVRSIKLVLGVRLGGRVRHPLFAGTFMMVDYSGTGEDAGLFDIGGRVDLVYLSPTDRVLAEST